MVLNVPEIPPKVAKIVNLSGGGAHWALDPREVILKSQIWKIWKLAKSYNVWCLTTLMMVVILFQTSFAHIWEIYYRNFEGFIKNALTWSIFELEKCSFFFKWVRISPEIDWYHYQGASPAPTCIVRHQTMTKTPTRWSVTSEPSVPPPPPVLNKAHKI